MRFVRYGEVGRERPGVIDAAGTLRDLGGAIPDLSGDVLARLDAIDPEAHPPVEGTPRLGVPVGHVGKCVCLGLNYSDHAAESGVQPPPEPIIFLKAASALCGATDPILMPRGAERLDWEVELGVVIGRRGKYLTEDAAMDHVAGYVTLDDLSERSFQIERAGQWTKGKSCDSFGPVGPWLVAASAVPDPHDLALTLRVNGRLMQNGRTSAMIFGVPRIVAYLSQFMTLHPGDVIATGTPPGVAMNRRPPPWLVPGDVVEAEVEGLGRQRQVVVAD